MIWQQMEVVCSSILVDSRVGRVGNDAIVWQFFVAKRQQIVELDMVVECSRISGSWQSWWMVDFFVAKRQQMVEWDMVVGCSRIRQWMVDLDMMVKLGMVWWQNWEWLSSIQTSCTLNIGSCLSIFIVDWVLPFFLLNFPFL